MSAKLRLTAWFTLMIVLLSAMVLVFVFVINGSAVDEDPAGRLVKTVNKNVNNLEYDRGKFEWDDIKFFSRGVYTVIYNGNGEILNGAYPENVELGDIEFKETIIRTYSVGEESYYIYDRYVDMTIGEIWVRGLVNVNDKSGLMHVIKVIMWSMLPTIIVLSILGGWIIALGTFHPIENIIAAASSISDGHDLSARFNLKRGPSEIKHLSHAFDRMFSRLEKSFNAEKEFASDVSHELRTPVAVILAQVDRSKRKDVTREDFLKSMEVIETQGKNMTELIEELLSLTRLQQGVDRYPLKEEDLSGIVEAVCDEFVPREERGIKRSTNIEEGIKVKLNPLLVSRIVQNLLTNAYKYGKDYGTIKVSLKKEGRFAVITVKDDGIGISEEDKDKIWQRFWQADPSRGEDGGSGLGLAMVKEMSEFMGGSASVSSVLGEGSAFTIKLPLLKEEIEKIKETAEGKTELKKMAVEKKAARYIEKLNKEKEKFARREEKKELKREEKRVTRRKKQLEKKEHNKKNNKNLKLSKKENKEETNEEKL
ncbi:MAG: HAMP domain-containing histidine kinase [Lachnospiraceae bacterium]|nr:HAMP domain-containing histidine kinase [Lachnospiraceae bacterium]